MNDTMQWAEQLTPADWELCRMVESLTGKPCEPKCGGDHYFIEPDYIDHDDPEYIIAVWDAIEGRLGDRCISVRDCPERHRLFVKVAFDPSERPFSRKMDYCQPDPSVGKPCRTKKVGEPCSYIKLQKEDADLALAFVGGGEFEGDVLTFANWCGVLTQARVGSYIVNLGWRFGVFSPQKFAACFDLS